ncbi:MAG: hypothetical protein IJ766_00050 [Clostridia bacterium]|nr:hypothetical protein [Clostridia bacterium]
MEESNPYVPQVRYELIPIKNLVSNQNYQRFLSQTHIARAVAGFNVYQINPVKVSLRDGMLFVINGQHTIEIVAAVSGSRDTPVWCMIYDNLSYESEADIFANQQKFVKTLSPFDVFKANIEAGNDDQIIIKSLVESYGLEIGRTRAYGSICAISTLESIYNKYGYDVLDRTLLLIIGAWEGDMNSFSGNVMNAVAKLITVYGDTLNNEVFKEKLGAISIKQLTRTAKDRRPGSLGYAEAMIITYNGKKKNGSQHRLKLNQLYAKENSLFANLTDDEDDEDVASDEEGINEDAAEYVEE